MFLANQKYIFLLCCPLTEVSPEPSTIPGGNQPGDWPSAVGWGDARFEPGTARQQSSMLPLSHHATQLSHHASHWATMSTNLIISTYLGLISHESRTQRSAYIQPHAYTNWLPMARAVIAWFGLAMATWHRLWGLDFREKAAPELNMLSSQVL